MSTIRIIMLILTVLVVGCASQEVSGTTIYETTMTPAEIEVMQSAADEWNKSVEIIPFIEGKNSIIETAFIRVWGHISMRDGSYRIQIAEQLQGWDDYPAKLRKVFLHELGHQFRYEACLKKGRKDLVVNQGHLSEPGNIMSASPKLMGEDLTEDDFAYINCAEIL